jgi:hypothetical protein
VVRARTRPGSSAFCGSGIMVTGAVAGNISPEASSPSGNIFAEAMRGAKRLICDAPAFVRFSIAAVTSRNASIEQ